MEKKIIGKFYLKNGCVIEDESFLEDNASDKCINEYMEQIRASLHKHDTIINFGKTTLHSDDVSAMQLFVEEVGNKSKQKNEKEYLRFTDVNVDGCGTDISVLVEVSGNHELTDGVIMRVVDKIDIYKAETEEWDTDGVISAAFEQLNKEAYECKVIAPYCDIEF